MKHIPVQWRIGTPSPNGKKTMGTENGIKLSLAMLKQIRSYADNAEDQGWYYGIEKDFRRRHEYICQWLDEHINALQKAPTKTKVEV